MDERIPSIDRSDDLHRILHLVPPSPPFTPYSAPRPFLLVLRNPLVAIETGVEEEDGGIERSPWALSLLSRDGFILSFVSLFI